MRELLANLSHAIQTLRNLDIPVVLGAHGAAIAGGCALLGGVDLVVADRACKLGYPVTRLGVSPAVSVPFLRQSTTNGKARALTLDPTPVRADSPNAKGLVHELVDEPTAVFERTRNLTFQLASKPAAALAATKSWLNTLDHAQAHAMESLDVSLSLTGSHEEHTRITAALRPRSSD
jgi:methylglutaconyl-CoA hydratase